MANSWLGNVIIETRWLPARARALGAHAASSFGAGFGGSVWALVDAAGAPSFLKNWREEYTAAFPSHRSSCTFFLMKPGPGASELELDLVAAEIESLKRAAPPSETAVRKRPAGVR